MKRTRKTIFVVEVLITVVAIAVFYKLPGIIADKICYRIIQKKHL